MDWIVCNVGVGSGAGVVRTGPGECQRPIGAKVESRKQYQKSVPEVSTRRHGVVAHERKMGPWENV